MSNNSTVDYELVDGIATVTLNRPANLNAMNNDLMIDLHTALMRIVDDEAARVLVLTGAGRGFCSGADLANVEQGGGDPEDLAGVGDEAARGMDDVFHPPIRLLSNLPVPSIAKVNGVAAGGGVGLALGCDIVIAARSARFVCTFGPRLGIVPDLGTTFHLQQRIGSSRARGMAMLGEHIGGEQAEAWGLIWAAVDDEALDAEVADVASGLARSSPDAMARIRESLVAAETNSFSDQLDLERDHQRVLIPRNMGEGAAAFLERREPHFDPTRRSG